MDANPVSGEHTASAAQRAVTPRPGRRLTQARLPGLIVAGFESVEEHSSLALRPPPLKSESLASKSYAIPVLPLPSKPRLRYSPGLAPTTRLNALLNAASDS
jgi:hypothetical protein